MTVQSYDQYTMGATPLQQRILLGKSNYTLLSNLVIIDLSHISTFLFLLNKCMHAMSLMGD